MKNFKTVIAVIVLLIESLCIFGLFFLKGKTEAGHISTIVNIPEGMTLTASKDLTVSSGDESIVISKGTTIKPSYVYADNIYFYDDSVSGRLSAPLDSFVEQNELRKMVEDSLNESEKARKESTGSNVSIGIAVSICWLLIGGLITYFLLKKEWLLLLVVIHVVVFIACIIFTSMALCR